MTGSLLAKENHVAKIFWRVNGVIHVFCSATDLSKIIYYISIYRHWSFPLKQRHDIDTIEHHETNIAITSRLRHITITCHSYQISKNSLSWVQSVSYRGIFSRRSSYQLRVHVLKLAVNEIGWKNYPQQLYLLRSENIPTSKTKPFDRILCSILQNSVETKKKIL